MCKEDNTGCQLSPPSALEKVPSNKSHINVMPHVELTAIILIISCVSLKVQHKQKIHGVSTVGRLNVTVTR